jgi:flagellar hook-associated protein 2
MKSLQTWKKSWSQKVVGFQALNTRMLALKTQLSNMDTVNEFLTKKVSSTNSSSVSATATGDAIEATHSVVVGQLAQNDILTSVGGVSSLTTSVVTSNTSLSFSYAGTSYTISGIAAGSSLTNMVNYINNNSATNGKVRATTIFDGSSYHLQLYGMDQGAGNQVVLSNTGGIIFKSSGFNNTQNAQSCLVRIDGFPASGWIARNSNTIEDVVPGVTFTAKNANSNATVQIGVTTDTATIEANIKAFVSNVNAVYSMIQLLTKVSDSSGTATGSLLTGNYGVQLISTRLKSVITDLGLGFSLYNSSSKKGDYYSALSQIGISTDADQASSTYGKLTIDSDALAAALSNDPDGVAKLFAANYEGESDSPNFSYLSRINGKTKPGDYSLKVVTATNGTITSATINGKAAGVDGNKITGLTGDAAGLVVELNTTNPGTYTGNIHLKQGKAGELSGTLSELTDSTDGPLAILEDNYGDIMKNIDTKISKEKKRLAAERTRLEEQYSRLDSLLNTLTNKQTQLTSTLASLTSDS